MIGQIENVAYISYSTNFYTESSLFIIGQYLMQAHQQKVLNVTMNQYRIFTVNQLLYVKTSICNIPDLEKNWLVATNFCD